jgi:hypothetical protein
VSHISCPLASPVSMSHIMNVLCMLRLITMLDRRRML